MDVNAAGEITVLTGDGVTLNAGAVRGESGIA
jgi:ATP-dependent Clp protease ATP-binding subunit ClpC